MLLGCLELLSRQPRSGDGRFLSKCRKICMEMGTNELLNNVKNMKSNSPPFHSTLYVKWSSQTLGCFEKKRKRASVIKLICASDFPTTTFLPCSPFKQTACISPINSHFASC